MNPIRIYAVDDSSVMRSIINRLVSASPDCVLAGSSDRAEDAGAAIAAAQPDVVTLDISMPGVGGLEYLDELRRVVPSAIVIVSASTTAGSRSAEAALDAGADACFDKARIVTDADLFLDTLRRAANRRSRPNRS